jgi:hypothetical protein
MISRTYNSASRCCRFMAGKLPIFAVAEEAMRKSVGIEFYCTQKVFMSHIKYVSWPWSKKMGASVCSSVDHGRDVETSTFMHRRQEHQETNRVRVVPRYIAPRLPLIITYTTQTKAAAWHVPIGK